MNKEMGLLITGYWGVKGSQLDNETRFNTLGGLELCRRKLLQSEDGKVVNICLALGHGISDMQARKVRRLLGENLKINVHSGGEAETTLDEIRTFHQMSQEHGWSDLYVVGLGVHTHRLKKYTNNIFGEDEVQVLSSGEILENYPRYDSVRSVKYSPEYVSFAIQEMLLRSPFIGSRLADPPESLKPTLIAIRNKMRLG